jgi:small-conductance mechanosensitive channel
VTTKVLRALLVFIGVMFALQAIGFDLTLLSVFGGALGVGIGLGLQRLAANYIAGFAILLDKSIKLGDLITVDNRHGTVAEVTSRYVVVRGADGIESIVPNEMLVSTTVLNHTHTDREVRIAMPFLVAFDTDVERVLPLLVEIAREEPRVLRHPGVEPAAFLSGFAETGLTLELGVWVRDPENGTLALRSAIYRRAVQRFAATGIRVPAPQREYKVFGAHPPPGAESTGSSDSTIR